MLLLNDYPSNQTNLDQAEVPMEVKRSFLSTSLMIPEDLKKDIFSALKRYTTYNLSDLSRSKLMNRVDTKFVISFSYLPEMLSWLQPYYSVLEIGGERMFTYQNIYYDSQKLLFYDMHHRGVRNRYKVRRRKYVETGVSYFEIKLKNNKNKTIKKRMKIQESDTAGQDLQNFIQKNLPIKNGKLYPNLWVYFRRITLANESTAERLTLDSGISYRLFNEQNTLQLSPVLVVELKKARESKMESPFFHLIHKFRVEPTSFSKYCIGCSLLYPSRVRSNRFKPTLLKLDKMHHKE